MKKLFNGCVKTYPDGTFSVIVERFFVDDKGDFACYHMSEESFAEYSVTIGDIVADKLSSFEDETVLYREVSIPEEYLLIEEGELRPYFIGDSSSFVI